MDALSTFIEGIAIFQIVSDIFAATLGACLCFGALRWRMGLITTVATYWGIVFGFAFGYISFISSGKVAPFIICVLIGGIIFPILTYKVPAVNRFVVGFLVAMKLCFMITTVLTKDGKMSIGSMITIPVIVGTIVGIALMLWTQISISAFVIACSFIGASQIAPIISKYINQFQFGVTGNISYLFDPYDFVFALFKIELTDKWTLIFMIIFMALGIYAQIKSIKDQGCGPGTPLIVYETKDKNKHGKIY